MKNIQKSVEIIRSRCNGMTPKIAIMLGSGLGGLADEINNTVVIPYSDLPGFPELTVTGHSGEVILGQIEGHDIICLKGRKHLYETNDFFPIKTLIRTLKVLDIKTLFLTSATGSLRPEMGPGEVMAISDHINYMGINPLIGPNDDDFGPRFVDLNNAWDKNLRTQLHTCAKALKTKLHEGVLISFRGPTFETPAEIKMAQTLGADAVGMSSVPECIIARHCGLNVMGCAVITNLGAGLSDEVLSHDHTLKGADLAAQKLIKLVKHFVANHG